MFILAHLASGMILGKVSGSYLPAIIGSVIIDVDHLRTLIKNKVRLSPKKLWQIILDPNDPYGNQRNILHTLFGWAIVSAIILLLNFEIGIIFSIGYLIHLILDGIDNSDFHAFYPFSNVNLKGPIKYLSKYELIFSLILMTLFFMI